MSRFNVGDKVWAREELSYSPGERSDLTVTKVLSDGACNVKWMTGPKEEDYEIEQYFAHEIIHQSNDEAHAKAPISNEGFVYRDCTGGELETLTEQGWDFVETQGGLMMGPFGPSPYQRYLLRRPRTKPDLMKLNEELNAAKQEITKLQENARSVLHNCKNALYNDGHAAKAFEALKTHIKSNKDSTEISNRYNMHILNLSKELTSIQYCLDKKEKAK